MRLLNVAILTAAALVVLIPTLVVGAPTAEPIIVPRDGGRYEVWFEASATTLSNRPFWFSSGHAFILIREVGEGASSSVETLGFHPRLPEWALLFDRLSVPGQVQDDSGHDGSPFFVAAIDARQLQGIHDLAKKWNSSVYNLLGKNCVDFARQVATISGLRVPDSGDVTMRIPQKWAMELARLNERGVRRTLWGDVPQNIVTPEEMQERLATIERIRLGREIDAAKASIAAQVSTDAKDFAKKYEEGEARRSDLQTYLGAYNSVVRGGEIQKDIQRMGDRPLPPYTPIENPGGQGQGSSGGGSSECPYQNCLYYRYR